ncbi:hypothetical protein NPIL_419011, partial [Nephila pilipes]
GITGSNPGPKAAETEQIPNDYEKQKTSRIRLTRYLNLWNVKEKHWACSSSYARTHTTEALSAE